jgi:hypothetical protein
LSSAAFIGGEFGWKRVAAEVDGFGSGMDVFSLGVGLKKDSANFECSRWNLAIANLKFMLCE